jgi:hypothetical protein
MWYTELQARDQATIDGVALMASQHLPDMSAAEAAVLQQLPVHLKGLAITSDQSRSSLTVSGLLKTPTLFSQLIVGTSLSSISRYVETTVRIPPLVSYVAIDTSAYMAPSSEEEARSIVEQPASFFSRDEDGFLRSAHCFNLSFLALKRAAIAIIRSLEGMHAYRTTTGVFSGGTSNSLQSISQSAANPSANGGYHHQLGSGSYRNVRAEECAYSAETEAATEAYKMPGVLQYTSSGITPFTRSGPLIDPSTMTVVDPDTIRMEESVWSLVADDSGRPDYAKVIKEVIFRLFDQVDGLDYTVGKRRDVVGVILAGGSPLDTPGNTFAGDLAAVSAEIDQIIGLRDISVSIVYVYHPSTWNHANSGGEALASTFSSINKNQKHITFSILYAPDEQTLTEKILPLVSHMRKPAIISR